ncbi:MAG: hypothetical protein IH937_12090 [Acidobacteria bacterium]|nr:hypothetical protein [Acidobacteriota bacterium]
MSTLKQDDLYTRFEKLFMEFIYSSPVSFGTFIKPEPTKFRQLFYYSWDKKVLPVKEILLNALNVLPSILSQEFGDHIANSFGNALKKLEIEEYDSEKTETTRLEETDGYVFRLNGDVWTIFYEGREFPPIKSERGMSLISHVLYNRGKVFRKPFELEAAVDGSQAESSLLDNMTREQLEKEGFSTQGLVDRQGPDKTAFQAYKKRLDEIEDYLAAAARNNDLAQINVLSGEKEALIREMENFVIRAQKGPQDHSQEKARKRVSSAIHRALNSIQEHEPEGFGLSSHLRKHLTPVSFPYSYDPDQPIDWTI